MNNNIKNIICFNPPFYKFSNIKYRQILLGLINILKKDNPLCKIINKNNVIISFSYTDNISKIIYNLNKKTNQQSILE